MVDDGKFEGESDWISYNRAKRNGAKGDANKELQLKASADKAIILTSAKGKEENMKEIMSKIFKNTEKTTREPSYPNKVTDINDATKRQYKKTELPNKEQEIMFQPDVSLLKEEQKTEEETTEVWEARL